MTFRRLCLSHRLRPPPTRQFHKQCTRLHDNIHGGAEAKGAQPPSTSHNSSLEWTPSQLLQFALTGSPHFAEEKDADTDLRKGLEDLFDSEPSSKRFSVLHSESTKSILPRSTPGPVRVPWRISSKKSGNLHALVRIFEANATQEEASAWLQGHRYNELREELMMCLSEHPPREILAFINGLEAKLSSVEAPGSRGFYGVALQFAARALSAPALKHYLHRYRGLHRELDGPTREFLIKQLDAELQCMKMESPHFDTKPLLHVVTGEGLHDTSDAVLHTMVRWVDPKIPIPVVRQYVTLLVNLRSRLCLDQTWNMLLSRVSKKRSPPEYDPIYACIASLVAAGQPDTAISYLKSWSARGVKSLPGLSGFRDLDTLFADTRVAELLLNMAGREETLKLFNRHLLTLERRLGVSWQPKEGLHVCLSDGVRTSQKQLDPSPDDFIVGYTSVQRLMAEIRALGCSKSALDLEKLADLLHEHDGSRIPVTLQFRKHDSIELAWFPQCSPIEFAGALPTLRRDVSHPMSHQSLGLVRARLDCDGRPALRGPVFHLMQLGFLAARPVAQNPQAEIDQSSWAETGHLVAWDRVAGDLLILFVGKGSGVIDAGLQAASSPPHSLPRISRIATQPLTRGSFAHNAPILRGPSTPVHLDVDPAADLVFP